MAGASPIAPAARHARTLKPGGGRLPSSRRAGHANQNTSRRSGFIASCCAYLLCWLATLWCFTSLSARSSLLAQLNVSLCTVKNRCCVSRLWFFSSFVVACGTAMGLFLFATPLRSIAKSNLRAMSCSSSRSSSLRALSAVCDVSTDEMERAALVRGLDAYESSVYRDASVRPVAGRKRDRDVSPPPAPAPAPATAPALVCGRLCLLPPPCFLSGSSGTLSAMAASLTGDVDATTAGSIASNGAATQSTRRV